jgi:hypothetical protein
VTLREILGETAAGLDGVDVGTAPDGALTWSHRGKPFATLATDGAAEFGLDPSVAAAAGRTPDVGPSTRGPGWVRFRPLTLDEHGADRARAWFESAHRRAVA